MKKLNRIFFALTVIWMVVIFFFSAQTGNTSANMSGGITEFIVSIIYKDFDTLSPNKQFEILDAVHFIIRKGAHFTEFGILGLLSLLTILTKIYSQNHSFTLKWSRVALKSGSIALIFSALYATSDEIHQGFTDGRYPSPVDVLIDSSGALTGILFTLLMFYFFYYRKSEK